MRSKPIEGFTVFPFKLQPGMVRLAVNYFAHVAGAHTDAISVITVLLDDRLIKNRNGYVDRLQGFAAARWFSTSSQMK